MQEAEGDLAKTAPKPAADDQVEALKHLTKSRDDLAQAVEGQLVELRAELQTRIMAELAEMHEIQASIRETTEAQAPRVAQKSRTALILLAGLSEKEGELVERTGLLLALVEETEFGIALPTALRVLAREMKIVQQWLKDGDASPRTVALEKRIEDDLLGLLEAMRRLPPTTPPPPGSPLPSNPRDRERELNRLVAELKMIRLLQSRLNDDTVGVDGTRPKAPELPPALRGVIETLKKSQDEIRDSLARISERLEPPERRGPTRGPEIVRLTSDLGSSGPSLLGNREDHHETNPSLPRRDRPDRVPVRAPPARRIRRSPAITTKMTGVAEELAKAETGEPVQARQKAVVRDLDELIASLEKECAGVQERHQAEQPQPRPWRTRSSARAPAGSARWSTRRRATRTGPSSPTASGTASSSRCPKGSRPSTARSSNATTAAWPRRRPSRPARHPQAKAAEPQADQP